MSLLMDALKKAEKDKQKSAKESDAPEQETQEIAEEETTQKLAPEVGATTEQGTEFSEAPTERLEAYEVPTTRSEFSLEPLESQTEESPLGEFASGEKSDEFDPGSMSISGSGDISQSGEFDSTVASGSTITGEGSTITRESTLDSTMPSERAVQADLNAYFEPSMSIQRPQDGGVSGNETLSHTVVQTGLADSSQVTADTVFVAGRKKESRSSTTAILIIVLLLVVVSVAGLYMYTLAPQQTAVPSPMVAHQIQPAPVTPLPEPVVPVVTAETMPDTQVLASGTEESLSVAKTVLPSEPLQQGVASEPEADIGLAVTEGSLPIEEPATPVIPEIQEELAITPVMAEETIEPLVAKPQATAPETRVREEAPVVAPRTTAYQGVKPKPAEVKISHRRKGSTVAGMLRNAYDAYQVGNDQAALSAYRAVLTKQANNRDAILGLAALAVKSGDYEQAYLHYRKLIRLNPRDNVASSALFSLQGYQDSPVVTESRLKLLLDQDPQAAHIHFSLGNLYARQSRWNEAQQAFFEAYRINDSNGDYVYNLAVSLDQLGQHRAALEFYRRAQVLAQNNDVNFLPSQIEERISMLADGAEAERE